MSDIKMIRKGEVLLILCSSVVFITAQVIFSPDTEEDVQLQLTSLSPPVQVITVQCYSSAPRIKVQYAALDGSEEFYDIFNGVAGHLMTDACDEFKRQYRIELYILSFIVNSVLVGGTFRLKATLDNNENNSTLSTRTYSFPAPFNLTGSSIRPVLESTFTLTCHVTTDYPYIELIKDTIPIVQVAIPYDNGSCLTYQENTALNYQYNCQKSDFTYTLTIPGSLMTEELQASVWRCTDVYSQLRGSKFMKLDIKERVMKNY